ncbi:MAG: hypothetical protein LUD83_08140 [Clostridiales bacterium]|nr:hypothetical protein [Clostridiales bacterium]
MDTLIQIAGNLTGGIFGGLYSLNETLCDKGMAIQDSATVYLAAHVEEGTIQYLIAFGVMLLTFGVMALVFLPFYRATVNLFENNYAGQDFTREPAKGDARSFWGGWLAFLLLVELGWLLGYLESSAMATVSVLLQVAALVVVVYKVVRLVLELTHGKDVLHHLLGVLVTAAFLVAFPFVWGIFYYVLLLTVGVVVFFWILFAVLGGGGSSGGEPAPGKGGSSGGSSAGSGTYSPSDLPSYITIGGTLYSRRNNFGWGVEYVNESNSSDVVTISNVYSMTGSEADTNVGHVYFN